MEKMAEGEAAPYDFEADLTKHSYFFGVTAYDGLINLETAGGMMQSVQHLTKANIANAFCLQRGGTIIDLARNNMVRTFLNSPHDTMVMLDADIAFDWPQMLRLLAWNCAYPVVAGAYQQRFDPAKFTLRASGPLNHHGLLPVDHLGIGFTAVKRSVFEALDKLGLEKYDDEGIETTAYFRMPVINGKYTGEDVYFFNNCVKAGIRPYVDPWIELGHVGSKIYNTPFRLALKNALAQLEEGKEKD